MGMKPIGPVMVPVFCSRTVESQWASVVFSISHFVLKHSYLKNSQHVPKNCLLMIVNLTLRYLPRFPIDFASIT